MTTLGSLFDGIGGWPLSAVKVGIVPVWASEIEPFPQSVADRHFPHMKQLGDITKIDGAGIEPVDIVCMGSPCQDLSIAGKREGLDGKRSGLFKRAIDIIRSMRSATGGKYPRFVVWENVPGAYSSNRGNDFRTVLEEIAETSIPMPASGRWANAGMVRSSRCEIAWRTLDAQYWGVPQRRKRIFLVADFRGRCAGKILFEPESVCWYPSARENEREGIAGKIATGVRAAGFCPKATAGAGSIGYEVEKSATLRAAYPMAVAVGFDTKDSIANSMPVLTEKVPPIKTNNRLGVTVWDMTHADEVMREVKGDISPTLNARMGTGGNQVPVIQQTYCIAGNTIDREPQNGGNGNGVNEEVAFTLNTRDRHAVAYTSQSFGEYKDCGVASTLKSRDYKDATDLVCAVNCRNLCESDVSGTLQGKNQGGYSLNYQNPVRINNIVRRLTPTECERLQGLLDGWTAGGSDSARYKALGNGMAQPCADFVMQGIARVMGVTR